jgi:hypothetical protein
VWSDETRVAYSDRLSSEKNNNKSMDEETVIVWGAFLAAVTIACEVI